MADTSTDQSQSAWTIDVQRGLAWTIIGLFFFVVMLFAIRMAWSGAIDDIGDLLKTVLAVLTNIVMLVVGYFYGSSKSSQAKDDSQNKLVEKLTPVIPPPVAPVPTAPQPDIFTPPLMLTGGAVIKTIPDAMAFAANFVPETADEGAARDALLKVLTDGGTDSAKAAAFLKWATDTKQVVQS